MKRSFFWSFLLALAIILCLILALRKASLIGPKEANLYFIEPTGQTYVTQTFPVEVHIKSPKVAINSVQMRLKFDPRILEVIDMSSEKSFCSFYLENTFDNIKGEVNITCGKPNPGFSGDSVLVKLTMRGKIVGSTQLSFGKDTKVLANDGKGTDLFQTPAATLPLSIKSSF